MKLTKRHRANLRKHAKYLYALTDNSKFDMGRIALDSHRNEIRSVCDIARCGTVMCSLGYAALSFPLKAGVHDNWEEFCRDIFGIGPYENGLAWDFLFSEDWVDIDNTITGAADRIIYFLKHGIPDDCWNPEVYQTS